ESKWLRHRGSVTFLTQASQRMDTGIDTRTMLGERRVTEIECEALGGWSRVLLLAGAGRIFQQSAS
ncbi:MAG TPA: hypothetical protein VFT92_05965, partial [Nitrospira sp.]|nr:hypothetical protein [Nitrospira sp.]